MSTEEEKPKTSPFFDKLNEDANQIQEENLKKLIIDNEYSHMGETYHAKMVKPKNMGELKKLMREATDIDQDENWDKYSENIGKRACILIEDMTMEKFDECDFYVVENLVTAWGLKPKGFRKL